jgi:hypothetical protein
MNQNDYDLMLPSDDDSTEDLEILVQRIKDFLVVFDFDGLDQAYGLDFLSWLHDKVTDGTYESEFKNLIERTNFWCVTDALDIAATYAEYLIGEK